MGYRSHVNTKIEVNKINENAMRIGLNDAENMEDAFIASGVVAESGESDITRTGLI